MANTTGTAGNDHLNGGSGSDTLNGLGGNDRINAGSGNDVVDGGSGSDDVKGDSGDDLLIYRLAENAGATDIYDGGSHIDTLRLVLTRAEWMRADVQADIAVYLAFIAAETNPNNGQASNREFRFTAFDLRVSKVEKLEVTVDGVAIDPRDQAVTLVADAVTTDEDSASASFDVMSNDSVPDLVKSFSHTQGAHGSVAFITSFNDPAQPPSARFVYTPDPTYWDYLAVGESATDSFTYTVTDADGDTQTVTVTVTGSNDAPIVTSASQSGAVDEKAEPGEGGTLTATGTVTFTDADLSDTHTASVTARVVTGQAIANGHALTAAQLDALKDAFSIQPVAQSAGGGSVGWSYAIADGALDHLGAGDSVTLKFTVRIDDGEGGSATQDVTITVTGTNDAPTLAAGGDAVGSVTEDQSSPTLGDNGSFGFDDADLSDLHTVSVGSPAVTTTSGVAPGFVPAGGFGTLTAAITESAADQDSAGSVGWTFSIDNAAVQALAHGQRVTQVYTLTIADGNGGTVTRDVTIEIIGTNDAPVVTGAVTGNAVEDGGSSTLNALHNASDVDAGTTLSVVLTHTLPAGVIYDVAAKTFYLQSTHSAFQNLEAGETRTVTVDYGVSDGIVTVPAQAIFTITGTNDAPVITSGVAEATGLVSEAGHLDNGTVVSGTPSVSRTLTATDVDNGATRTWSGNTEGTYGTFAIDPNTGTWTYTLDNSRAATQALREGQSVTESFTATVTDQHGASDSETIAVTIHGTNDRPVITSAAAAAQGSVVEAGNNDDGSVFAGTPGATGQLASSDVDSLATAAWSGSANGTYGTFAINPTTGVWSYTLDNNRAATQSLSEGQSAVETFTATVTDDKGATAIQMVTVTVNGGNDRPTVSAVTGSAVEDGPPVLISLAGDDIDADDNQASLTYNIVGGPAAGTAVILGSSLSFDPGSAFQHLGAGQTQQVTITYSATDAHGAISQGAGPVTTLARFDMADLTSSRSLAADIVAPGIIVSSLTAVGALTGTPFSNHFYLAGWGNTLDTSKYYEVTINPNGKTIDFDSVRFSIENAGPNTSTWYLRSSVDGFASSIATGTVNGQDVTKFTASLGNLALASGPITFRWYFTSPGGTTGFANHEPGGAGGGLPDVGQDLIFTGSIGSDTATITVTGVNDAPVVTGTVTGNAT
ncbi:MAG: VCBS domain-containing protein [Sphingosinicella sp.]